MKFDGLLICSGPTMADDLERMKSENLMDDDFIIAIVNIAVAKLKTISRTANLFSIDWPDYLVQMVRTHPSRENIIAHGGGCHRGCLPGQAWQSHGWTEGQELSMSSLPMLVNNGISMFTALHWLCCHGCKNIFGAGISLSLYPDGSYYGTGKKAEGEELKTIEILWERTNDLWEQRMQPFLRKNKIAFTASRFKEICV